MLIKRVLVNFEAVREMLQLPKGIEVAAVRQDSPGVLEVTIVDKDDLIPDEAGLNTETGEWIESPSKGSTFGASSPIF